METNTALDTAVEYLSAEQHPEGYKYFDHASGKYWVSDTSDIQDLGTRLIEYREADEAGEIDREVDGTYCPAQVYSIWCGDTVSHQC